MRFEWTVAVRFLREGGLQTLMIVTGAAAGIGEHLLEWTEEVPAEIVVLV